MCILNTIEQYFTQLSVNLILTSIQFFYFDRTLRPEYFTVHLPIILTYPQLIFTKSIPHGL